MKNFISIDFFDKCIYQKIINFNKIKARGVFFAFIFCFFIDTDVQKVYNFQKTEVYYR